MKVLNEVEAFLSALFGKSSQTSKKSISRSNITKLAFAVWLNDNFIPVPRSVNWPNCLLQVSALIHTENSLGTPAVARLDRTRVLVCQTIHQFHGIQTYIGSDLGQPILQDQNIQGSEG